MAFKTSMSEKGQIVISKQIRDLLNLKPRQKFAEEVLDDKIILRPMPSLGHLKGSLRGVARGKSVEQLSRWIDRGWV